MKDPVDSTADRQQYTMYRPIVLPKLMKRPPDFREYRIFFKGEVIIQYN